MTVETLACLSVAQAALLLSPKATAWGRGELIPRLKRPSATRVSCGLDQDKAGQDSSTRRDMILASVNFAVLGSTIQTPDVRTAVNSLLDILLYNMYTRHLKPMFCNAAALTACHGSRDTPGFIVYDDYDSGCGFEFPRAWVMRANRQRKGIYVSDFNTADKATLEVFDMPEELDLTTAVISHHINPASDVGGDARLLLPSQSRIQAQSEEIDGQTYLFLKYPSETITRSGYQIKRKNLAVAAVRQGLVYTLNASARSDQMNIEKEETLEHIVQSFRLRTS